MAVSLKRDRFPVDDARDAIASAARTVQLEAQGLRALEAALDKELVDSFAEAIRLVGACRGRVIVTGMLSLRPMRSMNGMIRVSPGRSVRV